MSINLHVQFMSPEAKNDKMFGLAKAVVHDGIAQVVRDAVGSDAAANQLNHPGGNTRGFAGAGMTNKVSLGHEIWAWRLER